MNFQIRRSTPLFGPSAPRPFPLRGRPAQTLHFAHGFGNPQRSQGILITRGIKSCFMAHEVKSPASSPSPPHTCGGEGRGEEASRSLRGPFMSQPWTIHSGEPKSSPKPDGWHRRPACAGRRLADRNGRRHPAVRRRSTKKWLSAKIRRASGPAERAGSQNNSKLAR
jgi:hypothetical protein